MLTAYLFATVVSLVLTAPLDNGNFDAINHFSLRLLENTYAYQDNFGSHNVAISPTSVWSVFALLTEGSAGDTFHELMMGLNLPTDLRTTQMLHLAVRDLLRSGSKDVTLRGQKVMFTDASLQVHEEFCRASNMFNTDIYSVDPSNTTKLAKDINYFICLATEGSIAHVVTPDMLQELRMILIDVLYFKASWTHAFDPSQTRVEAFYNSQGRKIGSVNMMYHKAPHVIGDSNELGAQILEMAYGKDERFAMIILVPYDGMPLKRLLSNLATQSQDWMYKFKIDGHLPSIECYVPRFKVTVETDLIPPMQYLGIYSIFDMKKAQLPGVSTSALFITKAIQTAEIEVTEEGTVAAASTFIGLEDRILAQKFEANKEFVFLIVEKRSNLILFAGVYNEPSIV